MDEQPASEEILDQDNTPSQFLGQALEYIKWVAVEPIWRAYRDFGTRIAIITGICVFGVFYLAITVPLSILASFLSLVGVMEAGPVVTGRYRPAMFLAVIAAGYGGYQTYQRSSDRRTTDQDCQNPTPENPSKAFGAFDDEDPVVRAKGTRAVFEYLDSEDPYLRGNAARAVANRIIENPAKFVKTLDTDEKEVAAQLANLLHDNDDKAQIAGIEALAYLSRDFNHVPVPHRENVYELLTHPKENLKIYGAGILGNMAVAEPTLADEIIDNLGPLCNDPDPDVREAAAMALAHVNSDRAVKRIEMLATDSNPKVRESTGEIIEALKEGQKIDYTKKINNFFT